MSSRVYPAVLAALLVLTLPVAAGAVTATDIIALSQAGVSPEILVAVIDADRTIFTLTPGEILTLKKAGVPNPVILKMLGTAREFVEEVPPPLIVGGAAPAAAETAARPGSFETYAVPGFAPVAPYYMVPYPVLVVPGVFGIPKVPRNAAPPPSGFGRFRNNGLLSTGGFGRFVNDGFIDPPPTRSNNK